MNIQKKLKRFWPALLAPVALLVTALPAQAVTPFEQDVGTSIDRGLAYLDAQNVFQNPSAGGSYSGGAAGLAVLALMEKRPSGDPGDDAQGYSGASAADKARIRRTIAFILDEANEDLGFDESYIAGNYVMALGRYMLSGGPDKGSAEAPEIPNDPDYESLVSGLNMLVQKLLDNQQMAAVDWKGYFYYNAPPTSLSSGDSSATQLAIAGLAAAKGVYSSAAFADAGRLATVNERLAAARQAYEDHGTAAVSTSNTGSDNASCGVVDAVERGHGYRPNYRPSLQQTASGTWIQILGGATVNDSSVQAYLRWWRNHYRNTDLDSMGNSWPTLSYYYYLWSSFKAVELIAESGINPNPGNIGPAEIGMLAPDATCNVRQVRVDTAAVPRVPSFGAGAAGFYSESPSEVYFDYAYNILNYQCPQGGANAGMYSCNASPSRWDNISAQSYALLVLQRATGGICNDSDGDGVCDTDDNCPSTPNPGQEDRDGDGIGDVCDNCPDVFNPGQEDSNGDGIGDACADGDNGGPESCDMDGDGDIDRRDIRAISRERGTRVPAGSLGDYDSDGVITRRDVKLCTREM